MSSDFVKSMGVASRYRHTQRGPLAWILRAAALILPLLANWLSQGEGGLPAMLLIASPLLLLSFCIASLTVVDQGDRLLIHYGPLPLIRKRLRYDHITHVSQGKTSWVDGWGIHFVPGRGWTYNLWGFDCVRIQCGKRRIQLGTDDPEGLTRFLTQTLPAVRQV